MAKVIKIRNTLRPTLWKKKVHVTRRLEHLLAIRHM